MIGILGVQFGFQHVHGFEEGHLFAGGEPVEDPGERACRSVEPLRDASLLGRCYLDDRAPPVGWVGVAFDEPARSRSARTPLTVGRLRSSRAASSLTVTGPS